MSGRRVAVCSESGQWVLVVAVVSIAALPVAALFATPLQVVPALAGAVLVGSLSGWLAAPRRSSSRPLLAAFVVVLLAGLGGSILAGGEPASARDIAVGWLRGPADLLTANLPLDVTAPNLAFAVSVVLLTAVVSSVLAVRASSSVTPLAPAVALFGGGVAVTAGTPAAHVASASGFVATAVVFVVVRTASASALDRRNRTLRQASGRVLFAVLPLAVLLVPVVVWQPFTGGAERFDPRSLVRGELNVQVRISPLSTIKAQLRTSPPVPLFEVTPIGRARLGDRVRIAALEAYDGVTWSSDFPFAAAGHRFFPDPGISGGARVVSARISNSRLDGVFLPVIGYPVQLADVRPHGRRLGFSPASGTVVDFDRISPRTTYQMTGQVRDRDAGLARVSPPAPADFRPHLTLPSDLPVELRLLSERLVSGRSGPLARLTAIEDHLRTLPYRLTRPAGHSYASVLSFLGAPNTPATGGFAEQRAASFAVLARLAGIPTRVAVGYRLTGDPARFQVTTRHAHAWPESYFPGYGWVPFEPTPNRDPVSEPPPSTRAGAVPEPPVPMPQPVPTEQSRAHQPPVAPVQTTDDHGWHPLLLGAFALSGTVILLIGQKLVRRGWRRNTGNNADRIRGAWREAMDRVAENGYRERACDTPTETVERAAETFSAIGGPLDALAHQLTAAVCSETSPDEAQVKLAWRHEHDIRRALTAGRLRAVVAVRAAVDPRSLWRVHARDRWKGPVIR